MLAFGCLLAMGGCGGLSCDSDETTGGSSGPPLGGSSSVKVTLPSGVAAGDAIVTTGAGSYPVTGKEQAIEVTGDGHALAAITEASTGKLISLAIVKKGASGEVLDHEDAALAMLHMGLGLFNVHNARRSSLLDQVRASGAVGPLATAIANEWKSNRHALNAPSSALRSALQTALTKAGSGALRSPQKMDVERMQEGRAQGRAGQLQPGVVAHVGENRDLGNYPFAAAQHLVNLQATNGYKVLSLSVTPASVLTIRQGGSQPDTIYDGPHPVNFLREGSASLISTDPIYLEVPEGKDEQSYTCIVLSGAFGQNMPAWVQEFPFYRPFDALMESERARLRQQAVCRIFGEMILDAAGISSWDYTREDLDEMIDGLQAVGGSFTQTVESLKIDSDPLGKLSAMLSAAGGSDATVRKVVEAVRSIAGEAGGIYLTPGSLNEGRLRSLRALLGLHNWTGIFEALGVHSDLVSGLFNIPPFEVCSLRASRAAVALNPAVGEYLPNNAIVTFLETPSASPGEALTYRYKVLSGAGVILNSGNSTGSEIESTSNRLQIRTSASTIDEVEVRAEAFRKNAQNQLVSLGYDVGTYRQVGRMMLRMGEYRGLNGHRHIVWHDWQGREATGRNRWKGGRYRLRTYRQGQNWGGFDFTLPEFIGRPFGSVDYPGAYPGKAILDSDGKTGGSGVQPYNLGDRIMVVENVANVAPGVTPDYGAVLSSFRNVGPGILRPDTVILWRMGD